MSTVNRMQQHEESRSREALAGMKDRATHTIEEYPLTSLLTIFGIGIGVGTILGLSLSGERQHEETAARIGRRVLDSISEYLPSSLRS